MTNEIEVPFTWHCPKCNHAQTDTVNPDLGPYINVTCGRCEGTSEIQELSAIDADSWESAMIEAERLEIADLAAKA
jgi:transcription elongation factor Elf1